MSTFAVFLLFLVFKFGKQVLDLLGNKISFKHILMNSKEIQIKTKFVQRTYLRFQRGILRFEVGNLLPENVELILPLDSEPLSTLSVLQESTIESYDVSISYLFSCLDILILSRFLGGILESVFDCLD